MQNPTTATVTGVSPNSGITSGSTTQTVTITGTNFTNPLSLQFGGVGVPPSQFTVVSDTEITTVVPPGTAGTVDVRVNFSGGLTPVNAPADQYTYWSPEVTGISPASGSINGSGDAQAITISGQGFTNALGVQFGATGLLTSQFTIVNDSTITACAPLASIAGPVNVQVNLSTGLTPVNTPADQYTYVNLPAITALGTTTGPNSGGTSVTITGSNFTGATQVLFGNTTLVPSGVSDTQLTVTSPAGSGTVDLIVVTPAGSSLITPAGQFMYASIPLNFSIPADITSQGVYLSMYGLLEQQYVNSLGTTIAAATNVILVNTGTAYDYIEASTVSAGNLIPPFVCISDTSGSTFTVDIPNVQVKAARVVIGINTTVPSLATISATSNNQPLPQATINVNATEGFATQGSLYICTNAGITEVSYTGTTGTTFTGCTGGSGSLLTGTIVSNASFATPPVNDSIGDIAAPTPQSQGNNVYDFFEFTYVPVAGLANLTINTSAIDQFGLPIQLSVEGRIVEPGPQVGVQLSRADVITQYATFTQSTPYSELIYPSATANPVVRILSPADQLADNPLQGLTVSNNTTATGTLTTTDIYSYVATAVINGVEINAPALLAQTAPSSTGSIIVAWAPCTTGTTYNLYRGVADGAAISWSLIGNGLTENSYTDNGAAGTTQSPVFDPLGDYFDTAIKNLFTSTNPVVLTVTDGSTPANGLQYTFRGIAKPAPAWINTATNTQGNLVIEFTCSSITNNPDNISPLIPLNSLFYVFAPFFNTNTANPANPQPPQWNGQPMLFSDLFPTAMAFGADGVFADNIQQSTALYTSLISTTAAAAINLPQATIQVDSTSGFQQQGVLYIPALNTIVSYTGISGNTFTGCTGGGGAITSGMAITGPLQQTTISGAQTLPAATITVADTTGYPASGTLYIWNGATPVAITYTGISSNTFTGCAGGTGTLADASIVGVNNCQPPGLQQNAYSVAIGSLEDALDAAILRGIASTINAANWANAPANLTASAGATGLTNNSTYYYTITSVNSNGESTPSEEASYTTNNTSIQLSWTPVTNAASYNIYRGTAQGEENTLIGNATTTVFEDNLATAIFPAVAPPASGSQAPTNLLATATTNGTLTAGTYYYVVTALGYTGESMASNESSVQLTTPSNAVSLTWDAVTNTSAYKIYRGTATKGENTLVGIVQGGNTTTFTDANATTQLPPPNIYYAPGATSDMYAQFFHQPGISIGGLSYADPYDDQGGQSSTLSIISPYSINITLQQWQDS